MRLLTSVCVHAVIDSVAGGKTNRLQDKQSFGTTLDESPDGGLGGFGQHYKIKIKLNTFIGAIIT